MTNQTNLPKVGYLRGGTMRARQAMGQNFYTTPDTVYINASGSQVETSVQDEGTPTVSAI